MHRVAEPVSGYGIRAAPSRISEPDLSDLVRKHFPLTPKEIIEELNLRRPIYKATASYGHFGRTGDGFTWERNRQSGSVRTAAASKRFSEFPP